jgi:hypothetical protein
MSNVQLNSHLSQDELSVKIQQLQDELYHTKLTNQKCQIDLQNSIRKENVQIQNNLPGQIQLNRIYNPLLGPERTYSGGRFNTPAYEEYQQLGFVYKDNSDSERYPLFGRPKYPGKTDKYEYYLIDETRNRLKIPFKSQNDNEIYDGDIINAGVLGPDFKVQIYDYDNIRYNPNVI